MRELPTQYQKFIHLSRYARWSDDLQKRETWEETVNRYIDFMCDDQCKGQIDDDTKNDLREAILNLEVMPSMRCLMTAGKALKRDNAAGYNCLAGDTLVTTLEEGVVPIKEVAGKSAHVIDGNGDWALADCRVYGTQRLYRINIATCGKGAFHFDATGDHDWVLKDGSKVRTSELKPGDRLANVNLTRKAIEENDDYSKGVVHGLIYGDGTAVYKQVRTKRVCQGFVIRLCSDHEDLLPYFKGLPRSFPKSFDGQPVVYLMNEAEDLKSLPNLGAGFYSDEYYTGFIRGWLAADGTVSTSGQVSLATINEGRLWLRKVLPRLGMAFLNDSYTYPARTNFGERKEALHRVELDRRYLVAEDILIKRKREKFRPIDVQKNPGFGKVSSVDPLERYESVYCFNVPTTHSFLLTKNVLTGNCAFLTVDSPRAFDECLYVLMCGTGVGFSVERQFINSLPEVSEQLYKTDTTIVVPDSKIGWAKSLKELVNLLYAGQIPKWDLSKLRASGARLKTFGGRSSGPDPLNDLFNFVVEIFHKAAGRKLNSIECHDIMCKIGETVVVGGVRRCLPGSTPVFTPNGTKSIKDIRVGDEVVVGGQTALVIAAGASGVKDTVVIKHRFGQLECTPDHRVAVFNSIMKYEFKLASEIAVGDRLVWDSVGYDGVETELPPLRDALHFNSNPLTIPALSPDVAWLMGLFHGDGHVGERTLEISGNMQEVSFLRYAAAVLKGRFGLESSVGSDGRPGAGARLRAHSAPLSRWFSDHVKQANKSIEVPEWIMNGTRDVRFAYLSGLLDADGRVRKDGSIDQATTIYKEFADTLVTLLAGLGIASIVSFGSASKRRDNGVNAKDFYTVRIVGNANRIMFVSACQNLSHKLSGRRMKYRSPVDFSFPIRWSNSNQGYDSNGNINVTAMRYDLPLLPTRVLGVEKGRSVETYDIQVDGLEQFTANGLVVHNSALISLSNLSDDRMRYAKSGQWQDGAPHRRLANNSVAYTEKPDIGIFMKEWLALYDSKSGERGIFNRVAAKKQAIKYGRRDPNHEWGCNPCSEINLRSQQFCNLSEVVVRASDTEQSIKRKLRLAVILGTMQSSLTDFRYLNKLWKKNCEEESLLGVSLTGIMDNKLMAGQSGLDKLKDLLGRLREHAVSVNGDWAEILGVNPATAITCVKPSGTVSQLTDCASGIHPRHSRHYIRTVRAAKTDPLAQFMIDVGFSNEPDVMAPDSTLIFSFPIKSPKNSVVIDDVDALTQLRLWLVYQDHWCEHKPSVTIYVKEHEWFNVGAWVYEHFDSISGVSFLPYTGHTYRQAPYQEIDESEYQEAVKRMLPKNVDWDKIRDYEKEDNTIGSQEYACSGDSCEML